jgi:hypothetical protein
VVARLLASDFPSENPRAQTRNFSYTQHVVKHLKRTLRIQIIILILIANFAFGQEKVTIDKDIVKYEIKDEFNRFDNIANELKSYKSLDIESNDKSNIKILNRYSTGFTGHTISIIIDKKLNVVKANYEYWTDVAEIGTEYKVDSIDLKLN